jgi:hypothetical protein
MHLEELLDMAYEILNTEGELMTLRISGVMRLEDQKAVQRMAADRIGTGGRISVLAIMDNFQGWSREDDWSDVGFLMAHGDAIRKMAIVGEDRWKDEVYAFTGKGLRETEIEFFPPSALAEAERWVRS